VTFYVFLLCFIRFLELWCQRHPFIALHYSSGFNWHLWHPCSRPASLGTFAESLLLYARPLVALLLQLLTRMLMLMMRRCYTASSAHLRCHRVTTAYHAHSPYVLRMLGGPMPLPVSFVVVVGCVGHGGEAWRWVGTRAGRRRRRVGRDDAGDRGYRRPAVPRVRRHGVLPTAAEQLAATMVLNHDHLAVSLLHRRRLRSNLLLR